MDYACIFYITMRILHVLSPSSLSVSILCSLSSFSLRFTRDIKPSDISLSFLRGKGELRNLDLNTDVISSALQLPPWINIDHVFCDTIKLDVPFTDLNKSPIRCVSV